MIAMALIAVTAIHSGAEWKDFWILNARLSPDGPAYNIQLAWLDSDYNDFANSRHGRMSFFELTPSGAARRRVTELGPGVVFQYKSFELTRMRADGNVFLSALHDTGKWPFRHVWAVDPKTLSVRQEAFIAKGDISRFRDGYILEESYTQRTDKYRGMRNLGSDVAFRLWEYSPKTKRLVPGEWFLSKKRALGKVRWPSRGVRDRQVHGVGD